MVNKVILIGNLGNDPELRSTSGGQSVCSLRLATQERVKDKDGNWTDRAEWHNVVVWGKQAENVNQYCKKGKQLFIEGRLQTRKWQDKDGNDKFTTEIVAENVRFLGGGERGGSGDDGGGGGGGGGGRYERPAPRNSPAPRGRSPEPSRQDDGPPYGGGDDDIPF